MVNCKKKFILSLMMGMVFIIGFTSSGNATLIDRGGGMIYDDDLGITWLQDANYANTSHYVTEPGPGVPGGRDVTEYRGHMYWNEANNWANNLSYGGFDDWRLPTTAVTSCTAENCEGSEMGHLFYIELGNIWNHPIANEGPFTNVKSYIQSDPNIFGRTFWSSTSAGVSSAWTFLFNGGKLLASSTGEVGVRGRGTFAWAVRNGDVGAPVSTPEPNTMLLLGLGLIGLAGIRRKLSI